MKALTIEQKEYSHMLNVILFSLIGGLFSLVGALILFRDKKEARKIAMYATSFAAGVLLAAAFVDLLPEAVEQIGDARKTLTFALLAILAFFFLERFLRFFHHHHDQDGKEKANSKLIIIGDTLHNALDGVAIGAAFLIDVPTGIIAALAVAAHEIPQEIGDFGILIKNGMEKKKVILVNVLSALATTVTAVLTYSLGNEESAIVPYLLAITAGFFIYIAASDIIPEIHENKIKGKDIRPWLLLLGAVMILIISPIAHEYIDAGHDHEHESHSHMQEKDEYADEEHHDEEHHDEHGEEHAEEEGEHGHEEEHAGEEDHHDE